MIISIVTPVFNSEEFLAETIESVIYQKGGFSVEYKIVDNCSSDSSLEIANNYKKLIEDNPWLIRCDGVSIDIISEPDNGMYDAVNKGFSEATGEIFAYINSDDIYLPGAFSLATELFKKNREVKWLKGITSYINNHSVIYKRGNANLYYTEWIKKGVYGTKLYFIQQDSTFWRAKLWHEIGEIDSNLKLAGDFYLWLHFAQHEDLYTVNADVSCFRKVENQLSANINEYKREVSTIKNGEISRFENVKLRVFTYLSRIIHEKVFLKSCHRFLFPFHKYRYFEVNEKNNKLIEKRTSIVD